MTKIYALERRSQRSCEHPPRPGSAAEMRARALAAVAERQLAKLDLYEALIQWPAFNQAMRAKFGAGAA